MVGGRDRTLTRSTDRGETSPSGGLYIPTYKRAAYEAIRDMIIELELPPGTRLIESDLAERLQVSKTPIREAIGLLEADGLVDVAPHRGATVRWMSVRELEEQTFLIDGLEIPAYPLVAERITATELDVVERIVRDLARARASHDGRRFRQLTAEYHQALFAPVGYPRLTRSIAMLIFPIGLRHDRVFLDNFDDAWDLQLDLMTTRYECLRRRDAAAAVEGVLARRRQVSELNNARLSHPLVAPYFR